MDTTEKYIEMCKAKEIQEKWRPVDGDFYVYSVVVHYPHVYTEGSKLSEELMNKDNWIWLPRQDQLQTIAGVDEDEGVIGKWIEWGFVKWAEDKSGRVYRSMRAARFSSIEQIWLGFVMYKNFCKRWDIETSEWIKVI